jgi:GxxExxY protein
MILHQDAKAPSSWRSGRADELAGQIVDAAIEVHRHIGPGFQESVYELALFEELNVRQVAVSRQEPLAIRYKGVVVGEGRMDLLVEKIVVVELKAVESILPVHKAQVISYLRMGEFPLGLLINFNVPLLKHGLHRLINQTPLASLRLGVKKGT